MSLFKLNKEDYSAVKTHLKSTLFKRMLRVNNFDSVCLVCGCI